MKNLLKLIALFFVAIFFITGCTFKGHGYKADLDTINNLNDKNLKQVDVLDIEENNIENNKSLALRAASMVSPHGDDFSDYLVYAIKEQLSQNNLYNKESNIKIEAVLLKNFVDIWGFSTGNYQLSGKFIVKKDNEILYNEILSIQYNFPSHFVGQIAIENGLANYPNAMKKLVSEFLNDERLIKVLK
ncbi:hypothetical protein [Arcobacter sp. LA11]|uniref:hypothetical protein n=1 Tax=Arcobacter sp. LA11 TaxID=1898176 RepID=UPI0009346920|nr:hypothetical protein [Arcobacter sp. LA11]